MNDLEGKTISVGGLLSQDYFFRVPEYQRPFSWEADNFDDLVDDIVSAPKDQQYFLGTIVLHNTKERHYDVVDGQQRLTSLLILLACLRDLLDSDEHKAGLQAKILQAKNVVDGVPEKVRLQVKDRQIFNDLVVAQGGTQAEIDPRGLPEPEWRYAKAVDVFLTKLRPLDQAQLEEITQFISQRCVVIYLSTLDFDDAFRLFTIVNDRGKQLRRIDVLKALNIAPDAISSDAVRNRIAQEWEVHEKGLGEAVFESVFHLVRLIILKDKPQGDLLREFQDRVFPRKLVLMGEPFLDLIFDYARLYAEVFIDRSVIPEDEGTYTRFRGLMYIMDAEFRASEWRACLLLFAHKFGPDQFYQMTLAMEKIYLTHWVQGVRKDERYAEYARILNVMEQATSAREVIDQIDCDVDVIREAARAPDLYRPGFSKYFLLRLELQAAEHERTHEFEAKSVEHVLPQQPDEDSYWAENHVLAALPEYVDKIRNLVLLSKSKNSSARNFDFQKKKEKYLAGRVSDFPRSVQVLSYNAWTREVIESRTEEAAELLVQDP